MKIHKTELLDRLRRAYEMEEVMAGLLTDLAGPHVLGSKISARDRQKVRRLLSVIHTDTLKHKKIVAATIKHLSGGSLGR